MMRKTKIVATLGPATDSADMIGRMIDAGVNVFRLNLSHVPHPWVRRNRHYDGYPGPAIRTGDLPVPPDLQPG